MTTPNLWEDFARRSRALYEQQAALARTWLDGQARLAGTLAGLGGQGEATSGGRGAEAAAMAELWRSWLALGSSFGSVMPGLTMPGMGEPGRVAGETLGRFLDPVSLVLVGGSQVSETIRRLTEGPRFADIGAIERRMARVMELWLEVQQRARAYEAVVAGAWVEANQRFAMEFQERALAGKAPAQPKAALKLWLDIANRTLLETHRSPRFLEAQAELLRQGMDFLLAERELVEGFVEPAGLPTRTEIDEVHRSVQALRRRVRILEQAAAREETPEPPSARLATTAAAPAARTRTKAREQGAKA